MLRGLVAELRLSERVSFLGHVDDMSRFYRMLDVQCLQGLPLSLLEAQASGLPVVATAVSGVPAAVCPTSGRLVASEDAAALAEALDPVLARPSRDPRPFVLKMGSLRPMAQAYCDLGFARPAVAA